MRGILVSLIGAAALAFAASTASANPPERRPDTKVEFPAIKDWNSLHISMSRTPCFGACPIYDVDIASDGTVHFNGIRFTAVTGAQTATIPRETVKALFERFRQAEFFWLFDQYTAQVTDLPSCILTLSFDGKTMRVRDYAGEMAGMPAVVRDLERAVDEAAQTDRWVRK